VSDKIWYCVISCGVYRIAYLGTDPVKAAEAHGADTYRGEGPTLGEATRRAALGAGKLTTKRRLEQPGGSPKRQGPKRKRSE
jgi:hypothetical protein